MCEKWEPLVMIFGPTGVGKSKLGIEIAKKYNGEIISMDSMQVYNELDILTNKVTTEEAEGIPHHLLSIQSVDDQFTVRDFVREADKLIGDIRERGKLPLLVGGTTYYAFSFFLRSGDGSVSKNEEIMEQIESLTSLEDAERQSELGNLLKTLDPEAYKLVWNNPKKIETYLNNCALHETLLQRNKSSTVVNENTLVFWISSDRKFLNERIDKRADQMVTKGLLDEIKSFEEKYGVERFDQTQFASIGLKQLRPLINSDSSNQDRERCIGALKTVTKRYAAQQEKYIKSKFCHSIRPPKLPPVYQLDATIISDWNKTVRDVAFAGVDEYLATESPVIEACKKVNEESICSNIEEYFDRKIKMNALEKCADCDVSVTSDQMKNHMTSRRHQKRARGLRRKAENLARRDNIKLQKSSV